MRNIRRNSSASRKSGKNNKRSQGSNQSGGRRSDSARVGPQWIQSHAEQLITLALKRAEAEETTPEIDREDSLALYQWLTLPSVGESTPQPEDSEERALSPILRGVDLPGVDRRERRIFAQLKSSLSESTFEPFEVVEVLRGSWFKLRGVCTGRALQINQPQDCALLEPMEWIYGRVVVFEQRAYLLSGWEKLPFRKRKALRAAIKESLGFSGEAELDALRVSAPELLQLCRSHNVSEPERSGL